jgi:hypothetical protein
MPKVYRNNVCGCLFENPQFVTYPGLKTGKYVGMTRLTWCNDCATHSVITADFIDNYELMPIETLKSEKNNA